MTTSTINKDVMTRAWELAGQMDAALVRMCGGIRKLFGDLLRKAWAEIKATTARPVLKPDEARDALNMLRNKDRWTDADYAEADRLAAIVRDSNTEEAADFAEKRDLINAAGGRFASVTFTRKDGSERTMKVQPAALKFHIKGSAAAQTAQRGAISRKANNPHLMNVWDVEAKAPRSINLATVSTIAVDGTAYAYQ